METIIIQSTGISGPVVLSSFPENEIRPVTLKKAVCDAFDVPEELLFYRVRWTELINARACYAYILREISEKGLSATKRHMGFKAHQTILNAIKMCDNHYRTEPEFKANMDYVLDLYNKNMIILPELKEGRGSYNK